MAENPVNSDYAARLEVDYPEKLDRFTSFFRFIWIIPIAIIISLIAGTGENVTTTVFVNTFGDIVKRTRDTAGGLVSGLVGHDRSDQPHARRRPTCHAPHGGDGHGG